MLRHVFSSIALCALLLLSSCAGFQYPEVRDISRFQFQKQEGAKFQFDMGLQIFNPNGFRLTLVDMDLDLMINGRVVGNTQVPFKQYLKKKSSAPMNFSVNADLKEMLGGVWDVLTASLSKEKESVIRVKGEVKARAFGITKNFPVDYQKKLMFGL